MQSERLSSGAKSGAVEVDLAQLDADLQAIIHAWATLSPTIRANVMALIGRGQWNPGDASK